MLQLLGVRQCIVRFHTINTGMRDWLTPERRGQAIMRVITGKARGAKLISPQGQDTRPTTDRVKEAMFSIIQFELEGARVLDLYAGSGQLGIEALSRGAKSCVFIDSSRTNVELIKSNLSKTGLAQQARVAVMDVVSFLKNTHDVFDIILLDPPYAMEGLAEVLDLCAAHISDVGVVLCETGKRIDLPDSAGKLTVKREYRYGTTRLQVYRVPVLED